MQNQNNNNIMISRQSGTRFGTPNSMVVLEQGQDSPARPSSGRRSVNRRSPLKRGGSSLEILPAEEDESSRSSSRLSNTGANIDSPRQTQSAGSVSRLGFTEDQLGNGDGKGGGVGLKRSTAIEERAEVITPDSPRKQVYLTTVKRNFEQHGMPKDEELAKAVQNPSLQNGRISNSPSSMLKSHDSSQRKKHGQTSDRLETDTENNILKDPRDIKKDLEKLTLAEARCQGSNSHCNVKGHDNELKSNDSYYISHGSSSNSTTASASASSIVYNDSYYLTHDKASSSTTSETAQTATDGTEEPTTQTDQGQGETATTEVTKEQEDENESDDDDDDEDENEEDEAGKAPFQLLGEFLEAVMEEDYENAEKLCKMVLLYEPDNAEAKQFQPLIEEMLKREREAQLWGSGSEDEDEDDDGSDDDSDSDDSDSDEDSDEDEDEEEVSSSSSSEDDEDEANEETPDTHVEK